MENDPRITAESYLRHGSPSPRRWRGALLPTAATVRFEVLEAEKRPVMADADSRLVRDVIAVEIRSEPRVRHRILFDPGHGLEERLIREQFA